MQLANALQGIVTQTLLPKADGSGRVLRARDPLPRRRDPQPDPSGQDRAGLLLHADRHPPRYADDGAVAPRARPEATGYRPRRARPLEPARRRSSPLSSVPDCDPVHVQRRRTRRRPVSVGAAGGRELSRHDSLESPQRLLRPAPTREKRRRRRSIRRDRRSARPAVDRPFDRLRRRSVGTAARRPAPQSDRLRAARRQRRRSRFRTEISFRRHHELPRASAIPAEPDASHEHRRGRRPEPVSDDVMARRSSTSPRPRPSTPFFRREISFRRKKTADEVVASSPS